MPPPGAFHHGPPPPHWGYPPPIRPIYIPYPVMPPPPPRYIPYPVPMGPPPGQYYSDPPPAPPPKHKKGAFIVGLLVGAAGLALLGASLTHGVNASHLPPAVFLGGGLAVGGGAFAFWNRPSKC